MTVRKVKKTSQGFSQDCEIMTLVWDKDGKYEGQWQPNMMDDGSDGFFNDGPDEIFIKACSEGAQVGDLTPEEMKRAE